MGIYLGTNALGGGGGSIPVGSYATFYVNHSNFDYTDTILQTSDGSIWVRTGRVVTEDGSGGITDAATYTDAFKALTITGDTILSDHSSTGGGPNSGIVSDFENSRFHLAADSSTSIYRWADFTPPSTVGSAEQAVNPVSIGAGHAPINIGGTNYLFNLDRHDRANGSTSNTVLIPTTGGEYPVVTTGTAKAYGPDSNHTRYFGGKLLTAYGFANHLVMSWHSGGANSRSGYPPESSTNTLPSGNLNSYHAWTVLWDLTGVTAGTTTSAPQNLTSAQLVGVYDGYALKTSATTFVTIEGEDMYQFASGSGYKAVTRELTGTATGTSIISGADASADYSKTYNAQSHVRIGTIDGNTYYTMETGSPAPTSAQQTYNVIATAVGDPVAKFARGFSGSGITDTIDLNQPLYVKIGNATT